MTHRICSRPHWCNLICLERLHCLSDPLRGLTLHTARIVSSRLLCLSIGLTMVRAQAPIDPALPEAPLPHERTFLLFPGYDVVQQTTRPIPALQAHQKYALAFRMTADVSLLFRAGMTTVYEHAIGEGPFYGPGGRGWAQLYGYNAANLASGFFFADAVIPSLAHQDPRYFRKGSGTAKGRVWWALRSEFVAFSDQGRPMPNYGCTVGLAMSTLLSDAYLPSRNISVGKTFEGYGIKLATTWGFNILHEYGGIRRVKAVLQGRP